MIETIEKKYIISRFQHFKWKFASLWPIYILTILEGVCAIVSFIFMGIKIWLNEADVPCFTLFVATLMLVLIIPVNIIFIAKFSNKVLFEEIKVTIDTTNRTIEVVSTDANGNVLTTKNNIAYRKEKNKLFMIGDSNFNFFYVPKAGIKKDEIKAIRSVKLREPLHQKIISLRGRVK